MAAPDRATTRLRASLVVLWLGTALVSAIGWGGRSPALLAEAGIASAASRDAIVAAGIAADLLIGLALWRRPGRTTYAIAIGMTLAMTAIATALRPADWLDPLGALLKNLPVLAALALLREPSR